MFNVINGVCQGGSLSPWFFNVCVDDLRNRLNVSNVGCHLNHVYINHIQYADDSVVLSLLPKGLQKLLNICEEFAIEK